MKSRIDQKNYRGIFHTQLETYQRGQLSCYKGLALHARPFFFSQFAVEALTSFRLLCVWCHGRGNT